MTWRTSTDQSKGWGHVTSLIPASNEVFSQLIQKNSATEPLLLVVGQEAICLQVSWSFASSMSSKETLMRQKKAAMEQWLSDSRPEVRDFAERHIRELDLHIADEHRRAEERKALRELEYEGDGEDSKNTGTEKTDTPDESAPKNETDD